MKERPIIFQGEMARAILEDKKTQTRRVVKGDVHGLQLDPMRDPAMREGWAWFQANGPDLPGNYSVPCPYGQPGDRLWVRETWGLSGSEANTKPSYYQDPEDSLRPYLVHRETADGYDAAVQHWRPSIHMPRWASRITLEIVSVRVERLQEVGEEDAQAEGVAFEGDQPSPRDLFSELWESINGPGTWEANPWVWVMEFKRAEP